MAKRKPKSPIEGRWNIVSMTEWDEEFLHEEVQAFIEFTWEGFDEMDPVSGYGSAAFESD